jgi:hypothetical protein
MDELTEYRSKLMDNLVGAARAFRTESLALKDSFAPIESGWNAHQLAAHTRDTDRMVYGVRARRTLEEDNPLFHNFDGSAYMAEHYDAGEPLGNMMDGFTQSVEGLVAALRQAPAAAWTRVSRHETQGEGLTLQHWVERSLAHIDEHLATLRKAG